MIETSEASVSENREPYLLVAEWFQEYGGKIIERAMKKYDLSLEDAEDLLQETFLHCVQSITKGTAHRGESKVWNWLWTVTHHVHLNMQKRKAYRRIQALRHDVQERTSSVTTLNMRAVGECLGEVASTDQRSAILIQMHYLEGYSYEEIAEKLEIKKGSLNHTMPKARAAFRAVASAAFEEYVQPLNDIA